MRLLNSFRTAFTGSLLVLFLLFAGLALLSLVFINTAVSNQSDEKDKMLGHIRQLETFENQLTSFNEQYRQALYPAVVTDETVRPPDWPKALELSLGELLAIDWQNDVAYGYVQTIYKRTTAFSQLVKTINTGGPFSTKAKENGTLLQAQTSYAQRGAPTVADALTQMSKLRQVALERYDEKYADYEGLIRTLNQVFIGGIVLFGVIVLLIGNFFIKKLLRPIFEIGQYTRLLQRGEQPATELPVTQNELGVIAQNLNQLTANLRQANDFSLSLAAGKLGDNRYYFSPDDQLGASLTRLHDFMRQLAEQEARRNWAIEGFKHFGNVLRRSNDLRTMSDEVITNLVRYVKANLGALFLLNDDNPSDPRLEMVSSYAYNKRKFMERSFRIGEGLVGQAALELEAILVNQIPENYLMLASGLGEAPPSSLLLVPLISNNQLYGVIEIASFNRFEPHEIEFIRQLGENIAAVISNVKNNDKTLKLLEQSRALGLELRKQSEMLQQNAENMLQAQEELRRANTELEQQMKKANIVAQDLAQSEKRFYTLLENASEIITILEKDNSVRYQSPTTERILGYRSDELQNFFRYVHHEDLELVRQFFSDLLMHPKQQTTVQYRYRRKDNIVIYLESVGRNLLADPSINGIVVNTRDITERIRADINAQRRMQFESLTENSPDLIIRLTTEGVFRYVNPAIENYTRNKPAYYIKSSIHNVGFSAAEVRFWDNMIRTVVHSGRKHSGELVFPSILGDRFLQVEMIPETNIDNLLETVLVVCHDITEMKKAEEKIIAQNHKLEQINVEMVRQKHEIEEKNADITASIQYAKRIQESILPNTELLGRYFADYFVFFKPRDIVSGDFYWFSVVDDTIILATVDCTGHGVPGAFMSLIANTLLNQVVNEQRIVEPGKILSTMQERIQHTLTNTDGESPSNDGMDIAICAYQPEKRLLHFAGGNRPIFWWHNYELIEIEGDKYGVGGLELQDEQRTFAEHTLRVDPGDAIYLFSDGYQDQFGGLQAKKFSKKRLREIFIRNQHKVMAEQEKVLEKSLDEWKGGQMQTDDIVILGIRF